MQTWRKFLMIVVSDCIVFLLIYSQCPTSEKSIVRVEANDSSHEYWVFAAFLDLLTYLFSFSLSFLCRLFNFFLLPVNDWVRENQMILVLRMAEVVIKRKQSHRKWTPFKWVGFSSNPQYYVNLKEMVHLSHGLAWFA